MWGAVLGSFLARPWGLRVAAIVLGALAVLLFLINLRRGGERAGRAAERLDRLERANAMQRKMLEAAARRPRNRNELVDRLRDGGF